MTDKELLKFVKEFRKGVLGKREPDRMCFAICSPLSSLFSMVGVNNELVRGIIWDRIGMEHYWLKLPDGRIIDPTASQFADPKGNKMPVVYLGEKPEWYKTPKINDKKSKKTKL